MKVQIGWWWAAVMKTGPNNARCIVWAIGTSFFTSSRVFYILTNIYRLYLHLEGTKRVRVDHCGQQ